MSAFSDKLVLEMDRVGLKERKQRAAALGVTYPMMQFIEEGTRLPADATIMKLTGLISDQISPRRWREMKTVMSFCQSIWGRPYIRHQIRSGGGFHFSLPEGW